MIEGLRIDVRPGIGNLSPQLPAHAQAVDELLDDLRSVNGLTAREEAAAPSSPSAKGGITELVLGPSTASAAWAVVKLARLWLERDRRRTISITVRQPGREPVEIEGSGENLSLDVLARTVELALAEAPGDQSDDGAHPAAAS